MTEEELNKVAGGTWYAHETAKYDDLIKNWSKAKAVLFQALNQAKSSGDPVAIQKAQEAYDAILNEKNLCKLQELFDTYHRSDPLNPEEQLANEKVLQEFWASFDYQHYMDWLNTFKF